MINVKYELENQFQYWNSLINKILGFKNSEYIVRGTIFHYFAQGRHYFQCSFPLEPDKILNFAQEMTQQLITSKTPELNLLVLDL